MQKSNNDEAPTNADQMDGKHDRTGFHITPKYLRTALSSLEYSSPICIIREIKLDTGYNLFVVGDPDNGGYEWVIQRPKSSLKFAKPELQFSNAGYGQSDVALRDGLIAYFGWPDKGATEEINKALND